MFLLSYLSHIQILLNLLVDGCHFHYITKLHKKVRWENICCLKLFYCGAKNKAILYCFNFLCIIHICKQNKAQK